MIDLYRERRLKEYFATMSLEKLKSFKEQYAVDSKMDLEFGLDNSGSLEKVRWTEEEIQKRH